MTDTRTDVLRLITRLNIGGPARQALLLTRELHDYPTVLAAGFPTPAEGELTDPDVSVRRVQLVRPLRPWADASALRSIRRLIDELEPRLIHTHMAKAGTIGRFAAMRSGSRPRTIHTFHGHVLDAYFNSAVQRAFIDVERWLARRTDVLIAISPEVKDSLLSLEIGEERQYRVIPLGFDLTEHLSVESPRGVLRSSLGLTHDQLLIGVIGRLVAIKDVATLLEAMTHLGKAHLAILGDGDQRAELEATVRSLGISDRVHFTGWWHDIPTALSDMDVVALSSLNEGTPVSLIEAAACARPVVATDVGGVRFVVDDRRTGLLCPPRDPGALAAGLDQLLRDPDTRSRFGEAGRKKVRNLFHKDRLVTEIRELYAELLR